MKRVVIILSIFLLVGCGNGDKKFGQEIKRKYESKEVMKKRQNLVIEKMKKKLLPNVPDILVGLITYDIKSYVKGWSFHITWIRIINA